MILSPLGVQPNRVLMVFDGLLRLLSLQMELRTFMNIPKEISLSRLTFASPESIS